VVQESISVVEEITSVKREAARRWERKSAAVIAPIQLADNSAAVRFRGASLRVKIVRVAL
jgi:hypothetical protein